VLSARSWILAPVAKGPGFARRGERGHLLFAGTRRGTPRIDAARSSKRPEQLGGVCRYITSISRRELAELAVAVAISPGQVAYGRSRTPSSMRGIPGPTTASGASAHACGIPCSDRPRHTASRSRASGHLRTAVPGSRPQSRMTAAPHRRPAACQCRATQPPAQSFLRPAAHVDDTADGVLLTVNDAHWRTVEPGRLGDRRHDSGGEQQFVLPATRPV
jgi:hypothetical protein